MTKKDKKFFITINVGITTSFISLIVLMSLALSIFIYLSVKQIMRNDLEKQIRTTLSVGSLLINGDDHDKLMYPKQENSAEYLGIKKVLQNIRRKGIDIRYIYTMRRSPQGQYLFVVDAETNPKEISHLGDVYTTPTASMKRIFANPTKTYIEKEFSTDKWGTWISGFAPIYTSNHKFAGVLGMDMSAQSITEYERRSFTIIFGSCAIVTIIVIILSIIVSRKITLPLKILERELQEVEKFHLNTTPQIDTFFKEIRSMDQTVDHMKSGLRSFKKYVPADLVAQLIMLHKEADLSVEKKELTMFFSDIAGFTTVSEYLSPDNLIENISQYFEGMSQIILSNEGTLDKYIGDSVMAFWGAPHDVVDHPLCACQSAIKCRNFVDKFNRDMEEAGYPPFHTRIGIHTGQAIVGNIGSKDRFNYTIVGDNVNLTSRLEGINKYYETSIIISNNTYELVSSEMLARKLGHVIVKGKSEGLLIYELLNEIACATPQQKELVYLFNRGYDLYYNRNWDEAIELFRKTLELKPNDKPSELMIKSCTDLMQNPPGENWSGVHLFNAK